jgi:hypothetical protein
LVDIQTLSVRYMCCLQLLEYCTVVQLKSKDVRHFISVLGYHTKAFLAVEVKLLYQ